MKSKRAKTKRESEKITFLRKGVKRRQKGCARSRVSYLHDPVADPVPDPA
jgi:hypothetical protein